MERRPGAVAGLVNEYFRDKRVLVTGHTGFKGAWLTMWLQHLGASVTGLALAPATSPSLYTAADLASRMRSLSGDVRDRHAVEAAFDVSDPQVVFHLAAQPLVLDSYREPVETFATNVMGTAHLLDAARTSSAIESVVVVTTDKCYDAGPNGGPHREDAALGGHDPYSASKACAELVAAAFRESYRGQSSLGAVATARAGNIVGGGDWSADRIVPDAVRALTTGGSLQIRHPEAVRPWQHVLDALAGYLQLATAVGTHPDDFAGAWNFGPTTGDYTVADVIRALSNAWGDAPTLVGAESSPFEQPVLRLDASKARTRLGWAPRLGFEETMRLTADWYRAYASGADAFQLTNQQIAAFGAANEEREWATAAS